MKRLLRWVGGPIGVAQLISLLAAALLAGLAGLAYSDANGSWQNGVRLENARSSAMQEQVRTVYGDEALPAVRVILDEQIAAQLSRVGPGSRLARTQQAASAKAAAALRAAYRKHLPQSLAGDPQYRTISGGADVIARLRVLRATEAAAGSQPDPTAQVRAGDTAAVRGGLLGAGAVILSLIPALLAVWRRGRRDGVGPAELIPQPNQEERGRPWRVAVVALVLWLLAAVVPMTQLALGAEEQRSQGASARRAAMLTTDIEASSARAQFATQAAQTARELKVRAEGRRLGAAAAAPAESADENAVADAEDRAATTVETMVAAMARPPGAADRLDPRLVAALSSEQPDWRAELAAEQAEADRSNRWGGRSNTAVQLAALLAGCLYLITLIRERISDSDQVAAVDEVAAIDEVAAVDQAPDAVPQPVGPPPERTDPVGQQRLARSGIAFVVGMGVAAIVFLTVRRRSQRGHQAAGCARNTFG